jgi:hypothetical protein
MEIPCPHCGKTINPASLMALWRYKIKGRPSSERMKEIGKIGLEKRWKKTL